MFKPQQSERLTKGEVWDFVRTMLPPWMVPGEHFCAKVNKNVCCARHKDRGNIGSFGLMFLGTFTGGVLLTETGDRFEERGVWHRYEGSKVAHWNEPITDGTKYAIVMYNNKQRPLVFPIKKKSAGRDPQEAKGGQDKAELRTDSRPE